MRIWSIHPELLDAKGLVALWREALLAQKVLTGQTIGYRNHPQLNRFKEQSHPLKAIGIYLQHVHAEAEPRGYSFDKNKIIYQTRSARKMTIAVTSGQVAFELQHLRKKLRTRDPGAFSSLRKRLKIEAHPLFRIIKGELEAWEIT